MLNTDKEKRIIISSKPFRRLADKTQVIPTGSRNAQVRTRLTHSLEVSTIAHEIAKNIGVIKNDYIQYEINRGVVENVSFIHDLGIPPLGHLTERLFNKVFNHHFDINFEANANNLVILEKDLKDISILTIVSSIKYPVLIKDNDNFKGLYEPQYNQYIEPLNDIIYFQNGNNPIKRTRTFECSIMDLADELAYLFSDSIDLLTMSEVSPFDKVTLIELLKKYKINDPELFSVFKSIFLNREIELIDQLRDTVISTVVYDQKTNDIIVNNKDYRRVLKLLRFINHEYYIKIYSIREGDQLTKNMEEFLEYLCLNIENKKIILKYIFSTTRKRQYLESLKKSSKSAAKILMIALSELSDTYMIQCIDNYFNQISPK